MTKELSEILAFMEHSIARDFESFNLLSFALCGAGRRNFNVKK
jgi:hypothetical protein